MVLEIGPVGVASERCAAEILLDFGSCKNEAMLGGIEWGGGPFHLVVFGVEQKHVAGGLNDMALR